MGFSEQFKELTGNSPFPWQTELFKLFVQGGYAIPARCDIPTGMGKTSVIAIWLLAREKNPSLPRRLVYVVNRRTVVDQTTAEVERYKKHRNDLAISTLRGQFADNREWSADPSREAVICGTVDMIGSRLLFSGYGVGYKGKPLHAGFLGQDSLIVHDEAHLEPAFQDLLLAIQREQTSGRQQDRNRIRVMELSATSRDAQQTHPLTLTPEEQAATKDSPGVLKIVGERFRATKRLHLVPEWDKSAEQVAKLAIDRFKDSGKAILIFVREIKSVKTIVSAVEKSKLPIAQLIGPMRGLERDRLTDPRSADGSPIFARFLPPPKPDAPDSERWKVTPALGTVYLVCTSAGEVGVNISADHMVCDLSTFESMAQRFGRVNRFGKGDDTEIHVVHPKPDGFEDKAPDPRRKLTLALLERLNGQASPAALSGLDEKDRAAAFAPLPTILPTSDILFDAWAMTSIREKMPGRPPVEPYLHGLRDWDPAETNVAWREEVGLITEDQLDEYSPEDLLDEYPLKPHELLGDRTDRVWAELEKLADRFPNSPLWIVDKQGKVEVVKRFAELAADRKRAIERIERRTVVLPHNIGGLTESGMLDGDHPKSPKADEDPRPINNDVADVLLVQTKQGLLPARTRIWDDDKQFDEKTKGLRHILCIDFPPPETIEDGTKRTWHWFERPIEKDNSKNAVEPVLLDAHVTDVCQSLETILGNLVLDPDAQQDAKLKSALRIAARFHDLGKARDLWQRSIGRPERLNAICFGKSGRRWKPRNIADYRHEFGSLVDLQSVPEFQSLDDDSKDLVQHLIAAHHGQARPHFTAAQIIDPNHRTIDCEPLAVEVSRRFARLQRKFGRWGLAYLESILRAADWHASATPSEFFKEGVDS